MRKERMTKTSSRTVEEILSYDEAWNWLDAHMRAKTPEGIGWARETLVRALAALNQKTR